MSHELFNDASWLIAAIMRGLLEFPEETPGVHEVLARIAEQDLSEQGFQPPQPQRLSGCHHLPEAVTAGLIVSKDLCTAIVTIEDRFHWTQMDHYTDEAMGQPGYTDNVAYAEIIGRNGFFAGDDFGLGLMLLGPDLHYIDHHHAAPELYWLLTGPIDYRRAP
ncbi:MAG: dimethylsulfonioproprionate lyase family protein, partial [Aestuariivirgaceae bacterium]